MAAAACARTNRLVLFPMLGELREPMRGAVETLVAQRGLENKCLLMGARRPIEPWIAACDILVAPAVNEGLGRTIIEANRCGTPVVASGDGGHLEIITHQETGLIAPADDASAFAAAVVFLLEDPDYARILAKSALETAVPRFSTFTHIRTLLDVYRQLSQ
jgi:glycosyltransferase involved in cell wall biosynthesis